MNFSLSRQYNLAGRTVAITGAAGGLGAALAETLRDRGANIALLDVDADAVADQAEELGGSRVARGWEVDVRDLQSLETAMQEAVDHFGRLDVVIAGAGVADGWGPMLEAESEEWERTVDVNLNGVWRTFKAALPHIEEQNGHMLAVSSMAAFVHSPFNGPYPPSKAGVWALCDELRLELRPRDVTVGSAHPTFFKTPMVEEVAEHPATLRVFNDFSGVFELVDIETVVHDIVRGIERRSAHIVSPRKLQLVTLLPGLVQKFIEWTSFSRDTVQEAAEIFRSDQ